MRKLLIVTGLFILAVGCEDSTKEKCEYVCNEVLQECGSGADDPTCVEECIEDADLKAMKCILDCNGAYEDYGCTAWGICGMDCID